VDTIKRDVVGATIVGSARDVLLAVAAAAAAPGVIAHIAEEWHADTTVMGSSQRRDRATMFLGPPA
jgi:nucleotide-binding universal stress UspA family protein